MIMMAESTAILFDHRKQMVRPVPFDGELDTLRSLLKVEYVDTIRLDGEHVVFVDDEGLLSETKTGFEISYKGKKIKFAGSGLLTGDSYGQNASVTLNLPELEISVLQFHYE